MSVRKSDDFMEDVERQFEWYIVKAGWEVADEYLSSVEATCELLCQHPQLGPTGGFENPRLREWRFFVVCRPFNKHVLFYEVDDEGVTMRRAMHGRRDLPRRLLEPPGTE